MNKIIIGWEPFKHACFHTARKILEDNIKIDTIIALARGGLVPARVMAEYIKADSFYVFGLRLYDGQKRGDVVEVYQPLPYRFNKDIKDTILVKQALGLFLTTI